MNPKNRRWLLLAAALVLLYGLFAKNTYHFDYSDTKVLDEDKDPVALIIERLVACESGGNPHAYHPNDGDGTDSRGLLQFKLKTFVGYSLKYDLFPNAEAAELPNLWTDPDAQIKVAKEMISEDRNNLRHWLVCSKKNNLI